MDFKNILASLSTIAEGETKETEKGRVHKGEYGNKYGKEDVRDQYGHKVGKKDKGAEAKKDAPKKGRGRPKKDTGDAGEKFDTSALSSVMGGKKPKKEIGKVSKKHSLKEYMESVEDTKNAEAVMEGMFSGVDHTNIAANLGKLAKVIKSVQTPEQFKVAQEYASRMKGTIMKHQHDNMGFGSGIRANMGVMRAVDADLKAKAAELGIDYQSLEEAGDQVTIAPAQTNTQVIKQGNKVLGQVTNPQLAATIKSAIGKGEMSLAGDIDEETNGMGAIRQMGQSMEEGKDEGKPGKTFAKIAKSAGEKYGSKAAGERVAGAVRNKLKAQGKLEEGRDHEASEYLDEKIGKILAREKPGMDTVKSNDAFYGAVYNELIQCGLTPKAARYKVSYDEDFISDVASAYGHYQQNPSLDEGDINPRDSSSLRPQHALAEPTSSFTKPGGPMAVPKGTPTKLNRPVPEPTSWKVDPIAAASDRAFNFIDSLGKGTKFTKEGTDMKDIQLESWEQQLSGLLTEGITVSSSQGQQGSPDSVSVTATDGDAESLLSVLRNAGIGGFGAEQSAPEIGYGVAQGGEEEPTGTGTEPQAAPDVVGDGDDMLALIKKLTGMGDEAEVVAVGGDEEGQDYEDEEGEEPQTLEPADSDDEEGSEESDDEEQTDEGNAFTGKLAQTKQGGEFKMGDKTYTDKSSIEEDDVEEGNKFTGNLAKARAAGKSEADLDGDGDMEKVHEGEHTCNECGMMESSCECESEQVEENFANDAGGDAMADTELAKLKALLAMGGDLHKMKRDQTVGNPTQVSVAEAINDWKKLSGIK